MTMHPHSPKRVLLMGAASTISALALTLTSAAAAQAHVTIEGTTTEEGSYALLTIGVPHGCTTSPTTKVAIKIPEEITTVTPTRHSFYTVEKVMKKLEQPLADGHGNERTERVSEVVYTAQTPLPADQRDAFELSLKLPSDSAGHTVHFPTVQTCRQGETAWVQIPAQGQNPDELPHPAPALTLTAASHETTEAPSTPNDDHAVAARQEQRTTNSTPWLIAAVVMGTLGLVAGGTALLQGRQKV